VVRRYFAVLDELRQRPDTPIRTLSNVATSSQLAAEQKLVRGERGKGLHQVGATRIADLKVQSVNLDNADPSAGKVPTVAIDVCWDVSSVDILDSNGHSVVAHGRANTGWTRYTVANYHWSQDPTHGWRIATGQDLKKSPCAAS
jgi:hypothetical protein